LPKSEDYNLKSQMTRAATSIALNIAEGSIGQTDLEQTRFLGMAIRSVMETVACQHLINRRPYLADPTSLRQVYRDAEVLTGKLHALRRSLDPQQRWLRDEPFEYGTEPNPK
ncbi:MAG: four helix bundle protein, partial [Anaerolineales bacterium]